MISASCSCKAGEASLTTVIFKYSLRAAPLRLHPKQPRSADRHRSLPCSATSRSIVAGSPAEAASPRAGGERCGEPLDGKPQTHVAEPSEGLIEKALLHITPR